MKSRVFIFEDDQTLLDAFRLLVKWHNRGSYEVYGYSEPRICPLYQDSHCNCKKREACADILIIENHLANMTGLEFVKQQYIRGCKGITQHKAIMSGAWSTEELYLAETLGCKIFYKPFKPIEILSWIDACAMGN